jgi:hypothetical protein
MEDFRRKARLVTGGHRTEAPATLTYASVVSRETVRLALTIAALNDLEVKVGDVLNAYITAPVKEKVWTVLGPDFGPDAGRSAIIVRALYGLKSAGAVFRAHLASFVRQMGYSSCKADPDLWLKAVTRPDDNVWYYAYILCYVDDILCIHHDPMSVMNEINGYLPLKPSSVGDLDIYLGAKLKQTRLPNGIWAWGLSPSKYVAQAVKNCKFHHEQIIHSLLITALTLTLLTIWMTTVPHSSCTSLVSCAGWLNLAGLTSRLRYQCYPLTWHTHVRVTLMLPFMLWDTLDLSIIHNSSLTRLTLTLT